MRLSVYYLSRPGTEFLLTLINLDLLAAYYVQLLQIKPF